MFVGAVTDDFGQEIEQKIFHCKIKVDVEAVKAEEKLYEDIPVITEFKDENGVQLDKTEVINNNYYKIKADIREVIDRESVRLGLGAEE